jgi:hypothetical protein
MWEGGREEDEGGRRKEEERGGRKEEEEGGRGEGIKDEKEAFLLKQDNFNFHFIYVILIIFFRQGMFCQHRRVQRRGSSEATKTQILHHELI